MRMWLVQTKLSEGEFALGIGLGGGVTSVEWGSGGVEEEMKVSRIQFFSKVYL